MSTLDEINTQKYQGFFIVLDGIDGCGKSTQIKLLTKFFESHEISVHNTAEPSQGELGRILRKYLKDPSIPAALDALLFAADRVDHCYREILPKVRDGCIVLTDRYWDSSFIYQSIEGNETNCNGLSMDWIKTINKFSFKPDITLILDIDPVIALKRKVVQNQDQPEAMEKFEEIKFQQKIRQEFLKLGNLSKNNPFGNYFIINANQDIENVHTDIINVIKPALMKKGLIQKI